MGKTAKAVAGIALAVFAPTLVPMAFGAAGATISSAAMYYGLVGATALVGASMVGSALTPEAPDVTSTDSYAGTKLQNSKTNTAVVPIAYGENRLGGNIIWQSTRGTSNSDLHQVIAISDGDIGSFTEYYSANELLTSVGTNGVYHTSGGYVQVLGYTDTPATLYFPSDDAGNIATASSLFPSANLDANIPDNCALLMVRQVYNNPNHTSPATLTATIEGEKVKTIIDSTTISATKSYSDNPADIVLDLLLNGLSISENDIDVSEFYNVKTKCNDYGYTCNIVFNQQANIQSLIKDCLATCRGHIVFSQGKWKLKIDEKQKASVKTLTEDDIANNSLAISMKGFTEIANTIEVSYINPDDEWLSATVSSTDSGLVTNDGQEITKTLDIKGCTSSTQASKLSEITLNTMRYSEDVSGNRLKQTPITASFTTTIKNGELEVGDVITLNHSLLDRDRKFILLSVENDQGGGVQATGREYCETHFKDSSGNYLI